MALHPGAKRHFQEELPVEWDPLRRALVEDKDWYRDLVEHSQDLLCVHDLEGRFLSVNPVPARLLGYSVDEILRTPMREFVDPQFRAQFDVYLREIERRGKARGLLAVMTRSGEQRIWEYHNTLRSEGVAKPIVRGMAHDVTERVRTEKALRATNAKLQKTAHEREQTLHELKLFRTLLDQSNDAIKVIELETLRFLDVNERSYLELGYSREELLSLTVFDIDPNSHDGIARVQQQLRESGFAIMETVHRRKDGTTFPVEVNLRRVELDREYVVSISRDITERKQAQDALRRSEENYRMFVAQSSEGIFRQDLDAPIPVDLPEDDLVHHILYDSYMGECNDAIVKMYGLNSAQEFAGRRLTETLDPNDAHNIELTRDFIRSGFRLLERESHEVDMQGNPKVFLNSMIGIVEEGKLVRTWGIQRDVTEKVKLEEERKRAEETLRQREEAQKLILDHLSVGVILASGSEQKAIYHNPRFLELFGYSLEQFTNVSEWWPLAYPDPAYREWVSAEWNRRVSEAAKTQGEIEPMEVTVTCHDGTKKYVRVTAKFIGGLNFVSFIDLTERKRAEEALRESGARERTRAEELETVLEAVPVAVCIAHDAGCLRMTGNRAAHEQMRVAAGKSFSKSGPPEEQPTVRLLQGGVEIPADLLPMQQAAATGKPVYGRPLTLVFEDGSERETLSTAVPLLDEAGKPRGAVGASIDVTELKQAEKALRESELRFRTVYERSPVGIALVDSSSGRFVQVNPKFCEIVGRREEVLLGIDVRSITHADDIGQTSEILRQLDEEKLTGREIDKRYLRPDGSVRWVRIQVVPLWKKGETRRWQMGLVEDITEHKLAEEALRQSEERFRVALKHSPIAVFNQDRDLRYTWMYNPQLPWPASDAVGKTVGEIFDPEEAARITEIRRRVLESGVGVRDEIHFAVGGRKRYLDTTIEPVVDATGAVIGLTGANMDVTELRETEEALREAKKRLTEEKLYLEQEIDTELGFGDIIGQSKALEAVMEKVGKVAASDATVLLLGETGTGKELVARAIHWLSRRNGNTFIKLNCAAIPTGLLESELFGHEKGAFTGAVSRKIGRLELADKGTLFLDEIGEISPALQPKLLRVLQDQEFERLGGTKTLKVDFRLIAATNRDLAAAVRENEFRSDLYYRLNVFPVRIPPLRERRDDIRLLVEHFVQTFARRMNKSITSIPKRTMEAMIRWEWPGNVRELENFIERSVILTQGSVLVAPLSELRPITLEEKSADETLEAAEREHILRALRESHGQIGGLRGAAMRLGLKRTTLQSKLKHLGINPRSGPTQH
jgi:PAS domain S-box-containing protein